jgi:hypothetical protein
MELSVFVIDSPVYSLPESQDSLDSPLRNIPRSRLEHQGNHFMCNFLEDTTTCNNLNKKIINGV